MQSVAVGPPKYAGPVRLEATMSILKPGHMSLALGALLASAGAARGMSPGPAPSPSDAAYDVVRLGDGQMACADLAGEINGLTREVSADRSAAQAQAEHAAQSAQASAERAALARRAALGGLVHASAFIPFGGGFAALAARSAATSAAASVSPAVTLAVTPAAAPETPRSQRLALLQKIFERKSC